MKMPFQGCQGCARRRARLVAWLESIRLAAGLEPRPQAAPEPPTQEPSLHEPPTK